MAQHECLPDDATAARLAELRRLADEDFLNPPLEHRQGRHTADLARLGLRVTLTRSRYPNRSDGDDLYAITISRLEAGRPPAEEPVRRVLAAAFGEAALALEPRPGGPAVRMYRVPAAAARPR